MSLKFNLNHNFKNNSAQKALLKEQKKQFLFTKETVYKAILKISIAGFINMFIFSIYEITDALVAVNLGSFEHFTGSSIRLALQATSPIYMIGFAIAIMISAGMSTKLSILMGQKDNLGIKKLLGNGIVTFFILMISVCLILSFITPTIVRNFADLAPVNERDNVIYEGKIYTWIILWGLLFNGLNLFGVFYLRAEGCLVISSVSSVIGSLLNIGGDLLLVGVFKLSLIGSAISTVIAWFIQLLIIVIYLYYNNPNNLLFKCFNKFQLKKVIIFGLLAAGIAPLIRNVGSSMSSLIINKLVQILPHSYEDNLLATYSTAFQITLLFLTPSIGIIQGGQAFIGYNMGSRDFHRLKQALIFLLVFMTSYFVLSEILIMLLHHQLLSMFAGVASPSDPNNVIYYAEGKYIIFAGFSMLFLIAPQLVSQTFYQAIGFKKYAIFLASLRYIIVFIPVVIAVAMISIAFNDNHIFWYFVPITDFISAIISLICLNKLYKNFNNPDFFQQKIKI